jgi:hypothetical protein
MDRTEATEQIKTRCAAIAQEMMHVNPAVNALDDEETQTAIFEASYELTKQLEIIKKRVIKLERGSGAAADESTEL